MSNPTHVIVCASAMADDWRALSAQGLQARLQALQRSTAERYSAHAISGLMICGGGHFLEWLEGDEAALRVAVRAMEQDSRHTGFCVIHNVTSSRRRFVDWSLCLLNRPDAPDSVGRQIQWLMACDSQQLQAWSPARMVRLVIKPPLLFGAGQRVRRIGLFGASSLWTSSFLAHLSSHWGRPVVRTRVVHGEMLMSESVLEYLDVDHPNLGSLRWVNCSGSVLDSAVMPLVLEQMEMAVLFQTERDASATFAFNIHCLRFLVSRDNRTSLVAVVGRASLEHMPAVVQAFDKQGKSLALVPASMGDNENLWQMLRGLLQRDSLMRLGEPDPMPMDSGQPTQTQPKLVPDMLLATVVASADLSAPASMPAAFGSHPAWLPRLLEIDSLAAAGWRASGLEPASGPDTGVHPLVTREHMGAEPTLDWCALLQVQNELWDSLSRQASGEPLEQIQIRWAERLSLSRDCAIEGGGVLSVVTRSGWVNEVLLRTQLRDQLDCVAPPTQIDRLTTP